MTGLPLLFERRLARGWTMKWIACASAAVLAANAAFAANDGYMYQTWTGPELLQRWVFLNEQCRGGAGDEAATKRHASRLNG
jgi:hypothetical protein